MKSISQFQKFVAYNATTDTKQFCKVAFTWTGYIYVTFFMKIPFTYKWGNHCEGVTLTEVKPTVANPKVVMVTYCVNTKECKDIKCNHLPSIIDDLYTLMVK